MKEHESYWLEALAGEVPTLQLPTDYPRPAVRSFEGARIGFTLDETLVTGLKRLAEETGTTLYMVLLAAYKVLLSKYTGQEEMIVGSPIAGRPHADVEKLMGVFVNTLALRSYPTGEKTFASFLQEVKACTLLAFEHQEYPFEELVGQLDLPRDLSRHPLFDTMFILQNTEHGVLELPELRIVPYEQDHHAAKFDLSVTALELEGKINISINFSAALFSKDTITRLGRCFLQVIRSVIEQPRIQIAEISLASPLEQRQLLEDSFGERTTCAGGLTFHGLFTKRVHLTPDHVAIISGKNRLTYAELEERSDRLAVMLRNQGVGRESVVALALDPSVDTVVSILGVMKSGAAYLPIDPELPTERIQFMLRDSGACLLLTQQVYVEVFAPIFKGGVWDICSYAMHESDALQQSVSTVIPVLGTGDETAYIIYTSGTTGKPKGVQLTHRGLVHYASWFSKEMLLSPMDRTALLSSYAFDLGYTSLFPILLAGGQLHLPKKETYSDPEQLRTYLHEQEVTYLKMTPSLFRMLVRARGFAESVELRKVRLIVLGGESIQQDDLIRFHGQYPETEFLNHYGPTETTIGAIYKRIEPAQMKLLTVRQVIGQPIWNTGAFILDTARKLLPNGIPGELYLTGPGLGSGYLNLPELTAERFVESPFDPDKMLYRTGDLARRLPDGSLEFLGRIDHQVKIRGYRIELGEIEAQLLGMEAVKEAVVIAHPNEQGEHELCAYVVAEEDLTVAELRGELSQALPSYMVPSYYVQLEQLPLTPNGKLDRKALPAPEGQLATGVAYVAPRSELEQAVASIWQDVLGVAQVGVHDNFFELGGHSLRAMTLLSRLHRELGVAL
ncbi:non-ribosomal peptide synthetase, partial [Paenibacillus glycinis]